MTQDRKPSVATGAVSRHAAYALVAQYLAAVPGTGDDRRVWRAVDLALDATGLPPMTAPVLGGAAGPSVAAAAAGVEVADRVAYGPGDLHGGVIGAGDDGETPHWRNLVDELGLEAAAAVVCGRIGAGRPITGLPDSWGSHLEWMHERGLVDQMYAQHGQPFTDTEMDLVRDMGVPSYAVAAVLRRYPGGIDKKRQRIRTGNR